MVKFPELIMQFRDRTLEMSPGGGSKFTFSPGKKSSDPPKLQGKNPRTPLNSREKIFGPPLNSREKIEGPP